MARLPITNRRRRQRQINSILCAMYMVLITLFVYWQHVVMMYFKYRKHRILSKEEKRVERIQYLFRLVSENHAACISQLRMDRRTFTMLCEMIRDIGGLRDTRNMTLEEIVAMFVYVLAHHKKNRTVAHKFLRSGETVSRHFNQCLLAVLKLHHMLLKTPVLISDDCTDDRWKYFKNCLGALDGTLISVTPPAEHKSRYRTRKSNLATNVLGICAPDMQFIYVLPGWEGSAHNGRVLRDAISRPNGLKVPQGCYYLVDTGYCNSQGFLAPYRRQRYHLNQIQGRRPESAEEYFNMNTLKLGMYVASELYKLEKLNFTFKRMENIHEISIATQHCGRGKNKCFWADNEVKVLIEALQEMACDPLWKTDGGFKNGYMVELHKMVAHKIPDFTKQVDPHIDSKLKWLKSRYHAITEMRHKEARGLWNMKFPYLDELELVYGKGKANGEAVEDYEDAVNNLEAEEKSVEAASYVNCETDDEISISTSRIQKRQTAHLSKKSKKLKTSAAPAPSPMEAQFEMVTNKFISLIDGIASHFASIATAMTNENKREQLASDRSNSLVAELLKLELCEGDTFRVAEILAGAPAKLNVFSQLPINMRRKYAFNLLYPSSSSNSGSSY
ncbi:hypothetical protein ACH5RR_006530 [Cinchona calisaya]|uniref:Transposase n=1 Tax=Cinchona calisaya TaxID=153742 RepID=A0ABD3AP87_9GENT